MFRIVCDPSSWSTELCLTEITRSGSQIFFVCLVGVWQRNFEPVLCVCVFVCVLHDGLGHISCRTDQHPSTFHYFGTFYILSIGRY